MGEISNKTLATLLVAAIVVSLVGTLISLNKVNNLMAITGMQVSNASGDIEMTTEAQAGIVVRNSINFGSSAVIGDNDTLSTQSSNSAIGLGTGWNNCTDDSGTCDGMDVENIGNVNVNLTANFSKNATEFIGGTLKGGPKLWFDMEDGDMDNSSDGGCVGTLASWTEVDSALEYNMCDNFTYGDGTNFVTMEINVTIPGDVSNESKNMNVTFYGTEI